MKPLKSKIEGTQEDENLNTDRRDYSRAEQIEDGLIENIQRENLNPVEEAQAYASLMEEHGYTPEKIAKRIAETKSTIADSLRLLTLLKNIQSLVATNQSITGHVKSLASIDAEKIQKSALKKIITDKLSAPQTKERVVTKKSEKIIKSTVQTRNVFHSSIIANEIAKRLMTDVSIKIIEQGGRIIIHFENDSKLSQIAARFKISTAMDEKSEPIRKPRDITLF